VSLVERLCESLTLDSIKVDDGIHCFQTIVKVAMKRRRLNVARVLIRFDESNRTHKAQAGLLAYQTANALNNVEALSLLREYAEVTAIPGKSLCENRSLGFPRFRGHAQVCQLFGL
jgi:hypothetical protein